MGLQEGYYPSTPSDTLAEFRNECVDVLNDNFGILCDNHHHEVATAGQCEIDIKYDLMTNSADGAQSYNCLLYTSPSPRDQRGSRMPSSA